ncbi:MAG: Prolyl oligopeptidase family protein [Lentisphaerae bacterium ADurb.BinA184]|nr:MAG: Prolyl oligopeptidase family protein [Lentisphaerae bacterium ADurb.BinA184]
MILFNPVLDLVTLPWRDGIPGVATPMPGESGDGLTPEERGRLISPLHFAGEKGTPPTLLVHGTEDTCVPVEQADRFAAALKAAGNGCDYVRKGGWKHAFVIRPPYGTEATIVESLAAADGFLSSLGWIEGTPTITLADAAAAQPFPLVTDLPGNPPAGGLRHWKPPLRPLGATGAYVSVVVRPEAGRAKYELWCNAWGEDGAASRGIVVRRGESLDRLGEATTVCDGTLISDVMAPGQAAALAPGRGYTRTAMLTDPEYGYVQFCCVCPDYLPGSVPLLPAVLVSRTGEAGSFRYLGKLKGDFAAEAAKRTVWSDGGSLIRLADGRWRAYVNGFGTVLAAAESDRLDGEWRFLCAADGSIRELFAEFPKGPHGGGCFPTVLRVAEGNWHAWITDTWPPQSIWHFHSEDGLSWKRFGRQPEITRLAVDGQGIKCLRAYVAPDTQEIVGLLSVWQTGPDAEAAWMLHELRMPSDLRP